MYLDPLIHVPLAVQVHVIAAMVAVILGPFVLYRNNRDRLHRVLGYVWVANVGVAAIVSFWITGIKVIGPFSPIHLLSVFAIWSLWQGIQHARHGRIGQHMGTMRGLYWGAMGLAGLFTLLPGRRINVILFGGNEMLGLYVIGMVMSVVALRYFWQRRGTKSFG